MNLSLVIPVFNDPEGVGRRLAQVATLGLFCEVVVIDDASENRSDPAALRLDPDTLPFALKYHRVRIRLPDCRYRPESGCTCRHRHPRARPSGISPRNAVSAG